MSRPDQRSARERLLSLAAAAEPAPLAATDARRMARQALLAGGARRKASAERATFWLALSGLAGAALVAIGLRFAAEGTSARPTVAEPPHPIPLRMQLPSHDTLVAVPGAQFELASADAHDRRIQLRSGALAFDVVPLAEGERFVVDTPHLQVRVRGTVFSVAVRAGRTEVRAYEGVVVVDAAGVARELRAGESYASDGSALRQDDAAPLQRDAAGMAARRARPQPRQPPPPARADAAALPVPALVEPAPPLAEKTAPEHALLGGATLEQARAWLHAGQPERALTAAQRRHASERSGDWLLLEADALRSLSRVREAARAYGGAARTLPDAPRAQAGFKAADLLLRELDDPRSALAALHESAADAPGSALRERGLLLRIEALERLGEPIAEVAGRYLAEFPDSAGAPRLRALLEREP